MNISHVGDGKVVLLSGGGKVYTDIAARFVGSERSLNEIIASPYNKKIVQNILDSNHGAALEFDYFVFGIEGYSRVTEVQLVRKRLASYLIKSGRVNKKGKRSYDVVLPKSIEDVHTNIDLDTKHIYLSNGQSLYNHLNSFTQKVLNRKLNPNAARIRIDTLGLLEWMESWYNSGVEQGVPEEDLRYLKGQCTEWKGVFGLNCHALLDWFKIRCCQNCMTETRDLANKILKLCKEASPDLFQNAGPSCRSLGYCPENDRQSKNCTGILTHKETLKLIKLHNKKGE